jgi:hypothetical protein
MQQGQFQQGKKDIPEKSRDFKQRSGEVKDNVRPTKEQQEEFPGLYKESPISPPRAEDFTKAKEGGFVPKDSQELSSESMEAKPFYAAGVEKAAELKDTVLHKAHDAYDVVAEKATQLKESAAYYANTEKLKEGASHLKDQVSAVIEKGKGYGIPDNERPTKEQQDEFPGLYKESPISPPRAADFPGEKGLGDSEEAKPFYAAGVEKAAELKDTVLHKAHDAYDVVAEKATQLKETVFHKTEETLGVVREWKDDAALKAQESFGAAKEKAIGIKDKVAGGYDAAMDYASAATKVEGEEEKDAPLDEVSSGLEEGMPQGSTITAKLAEMKDAAVEMMKQGIQLARHPLGGADDATAKDFDKTKDKFGAFDVESELPLDRKSGEAKEWAHVPADEVKLKQEHLHPLFNKSGKQAEQQQHSARIE